jgi:DNA polymerase-3 subunit delta
MIYLLYGPDELIRTEALALLKQTVPADVADLNITTLDGRRLKVDTLIGTCEAFPFMADRRLVIVQDLLKHQKAGSDRDQVRTFLDRLPSTCDLVFLETEEFDKRNALFTYLKEGAKKGRAEVREFLPREGADLLRWLSERAAELQVTLEPAAAQRLIEFIGGESRPLFNELKKLASYVGKNGRITRSHVDFLVQDGQEQNLFAFIDELSLRRRGPALQGLRRLLDDGQAAPYILFMIARQVRLLIQVKALAEQRIRPDEIASQLGQRPFVVKKALDQARGFRDTELLTLHDRIVAFDQATKTGRIEPETALDLLVVETCR